jgi:hypothetical protein
MSKDNKPQMVTINDVEYDAQLHLLTSRLLDESLLDLDQED